MEEGAETRGDYIFSFGTPAKETSQYPRVTPSAGKTVRFMGSPDEMGRSPEGQEFQRPASVGRGVYDNYPCKSPNERLIDIKNSTWKTKKEMAFHGRHLDGKLLYTVGPREAYVVDKTFDREMNFLKLGQLSHDGELVFRKQGERQYVTEVGGDDYRGQHAGSRSNVTNEMRSKLYEDMFKEHEVVLSSPKKYPRKQQ